MTEDQTAGPLVRILSIVVCPTCGYAEVEQPEGYGPSDDWCGHSREAFVRSPALLWMPERKPE